MRYAEKMYMQAVKLLEYELWAEEIVQDVFTKLWNVRSSLKEVGNPSAYLYKIASNRTRDLLKHKKVEIKVHYKLLRYAASSTRNEGEDSLDFQRTENLLKQALDELTTQKKTIFRLKHEQGMTLEEIGKELGLSRNTVRNHLAEAMQTLRTYLLKHGVYLVICLWDMANMNK